MHTLKQQFIGYDAFFCTLGSRTKFGEAEFTKVDRFYPNLFGAMGKEISIRYFGLLTSIRANPNSMLLYLRTKGLVENDLIKLNLNKLVIYRPGIITNRHEGNTKRFVEKILAYSCFQKIDTARLARAMLFNSFIELSLKSKGVKILENKDLLQICK